MGIVLNTKLFIQIAIIIYFVTGLHPANAVAQDSITLAWEWDAGGSGYTSGPNGDIAYHLYMRTEDDVAYDDDFPAITGIDDCWSDNGRYHCQVTLLHAFEPGVRYFFTVAAYLVSDRQSISTLSNEIEYTVETAMNNTSAVDDGQDDAVANASSPDSIGGGCFIACGL
jgi:hypothetical protein